MDQHTKTHKDASSKKFSIRSEAKVTACSEQFLVLFFYTIQGLYFVNSLRTKVAIYHNTHFSNIAVVDYSLANQFSQSVGCCRWG